MVKGVVENRSDTSIELKQTNSIENMWLRDVKIKETARGSVLTGFLCYGDNVVNSGLNSFKIYLDNLLDGEHEVDYFHYSNKGEREVFPKDYFPEDLEDLREHIDIRSVMEYYIVYEKMKYVNLAMHKSMLDNFKECEQADIEGYTLVHNSLLASFYEEFVEEKQSLLRLINEVSEHKKLMVEYKKEEGKEVQLLSLKEEIKIKNARIKSLTKSLTESVADELYFNKIQFILILAVIRELGTTYAMMARIFPNQFCMVAYACNTSLLGVNNCVGDLLPITGVSTKIMDYASFMVNISKIVKKAETQLKNPVWAYFGYNERFDFNFRKEDVVELFKP